MRWWCSHIPNAYLGDGGKDLSGGGTGYSPSVPRVAGLPFATISNRSEWALLKFSLACFFNIKVYRDFPGGPFVRTLCFHCRGHA